MSSAFLGATLLASTCARADRYGTTLVATYAARVPAPGGPGIAGTPLGERRGAFELALAHDVNGTGAATRAGGGLAHVLPSPRGEARAYLRAGRHVEVGPSIEWGFGAGTPAAPDTPADLGEEWVRVGLNARVFLVPPRAWTLGLNLDVLVSGIVYRSRRSSTTRRYAFASCPSLLGPCERRDPANDAVVAEETVDRSGRAVRADARLGVFAGGRLGRRVWILGGALLQTHPEYRGEVRDGFTCETQAECSDLSGYDAPTGTTFLGTFWIVVGVDVDRFSFSLQARTSPLGSPEIFARSPFGLTLSTRVGF